MLWNVGKDCAFILVGCIGRKWKSYFLSLSFVFLCGMHAFLQFSCCLTVSIILGKNQYCWQMSSGQQGNNSSSSLQHKSLIKSLAAKLRACVVGLPWAHGLLTLSTLSGHFQLLKGLGDKEIRLLCRCSSWEEHSISNMWAVKKVINAGKKVKNDCAL